MSLLPVLSGLLLLSTRRSSYSAVVPLRPSVIAGRISRLPHKEPKELKSDSEAAVTREKQRQLPGQSVACNYRPLSMSYGQIEGTVAQCFGIRFPGRCYSSVGG